MSRKQLTIKSKSDKEMDLVISYLLDKEDKLKSLLKAVYLPYLLSPKDPNYRIVLIESANQCEAIAKSIREYGGYSLHGGTILNPINFGVTQLLNDFQKDVKESSISIEKHNSDIDKTQDLEMINEDDEYEDDDDELPGEGQFLTKFNQSKGI